MLETWVWVLVAVTLAGISYGLYRRTLRERLAQALEITCLLCDSADVTVLNTAEGQEDRYRCRRCGYSTDLAKRADTAPLVETFRDIKQAAEYLRQAQDLLQGGAPGLLDPRALSSSNPAAERAAEVNRLRQSALSLLGDLTRRHPDLLEIPQVHEAHSRIRPFLEAVSAPGASVPTEVLIDSKGFVDAARSLESFRDDYARYLLEQSRREPPSGTGDGHAGP